MVVSTRCFDCVSNAEVYDLDKALIAAGYPMMTEIDGRDKVEEKDLNRAKKLVNASKTDNNAHSQFLSGILVAFDLSLTTKAWIEASRYRFLTFTSSQSTMHRITKFDLSKQYIKYTDSRMVEIMREKIEDYNNEPTAEKYLGILYSNPAGFILTARMTTNYRCLRNIYNQRKNHKLPEWREFCKWIETLPLAQELLIN